VHVEVKVQLLHPHAVLPRYAHYGDSGDLAADLFAVEDMTIQPRQTAVIPTGIAVQLPPGFGALIEDRSGLATLGLTTLAGVVDPGYRGELRVVLANLGNSTHMLRRGDRFAQLRLVHRIHGEFVETSGLGESERSDSGFGSTGR
jgi:dUTP pyrophosphatase